MVAVLASCGGNQISLWNIPGEDVPINSFNPEYLPSSRYGSDGANVSCLCWNKSAQVLAASTLSGTIYMYSQVGQLQHTLRPDDPVLKSEDSHMSCITFSSHALSVCSGGGDSLLRLWDCKRKEIVKVFQGHRASISSVSFTERDEGLLSSSQLGDLLLHNVNSGEYVALQVSDQAVCANSINVLQLSPFKKSTAAVGLEKSGVQIWDTQRAVSTMTFSHHKGQVKGVSFSPVNELLLCSAGLDKQLHFYDVQANKLVKTILCEAPLESLDFMNDGFTVAAGTSDGCIVVYDLRTLGSGASHSLSFAAHTPLPVTSLQFQHAPSHRSRSKNRQVGKENAQPQGQGAASDRSSNADSSFRPPSAGSSSSSNSAAQRPSVSSADPSRLSSSFPTSAPSQASIPPNESLRAPSPKDPMHSSRGNFKPDTFRADAESQQRQERGLPSGAFGTGREAYDTDSRPNSVVNASALMRDPPESNSKNQDKSQLEILQELERIRQQRSMLMSSRDQTKDQRTVSLPLEAPARAAGYDLHLQPTSSQLPSSPLSSSSSTRSQAAGAGIAINLDSVSGKRLEPPHGSCLSEAASSISRASSRGTAPLATEVAARQTPPRSAENSGLRQQEAKGGGQATGGDQRIPPDLIPLFKGILDESMESLRESIRADVQNLHIDMLRQFHLQQRELKEELAAYAAANAELKEELVRLREQAEFVRYLH